MYHTDSYLNIRKGHRQGLRSSSPTATNLSALMHRTADDADIRNHSAYFKAALTHRQRDADVRNHSALIPLLSDPSENTHILEFRDHLVECLLTENGLLDIPINRRFLKMLIDIQDPRLIVLWRAPTPWFHVGVFGTLGSQDKK
jgi:hypothetical protein